MAISHSSQYNLNKTLFSSCHIHLTPPCIILMKREVAGSNKKKFNFNKLSCKNKIFCDAFEEKNNSTNYSNNRVNNT